MTEDRNPKLQALFAEAEQELPGEAFTAQVMVQTRAIKKRAMLGWLCLGLMLIPCLWLLAMPLQEAAQLLTQMAAVSLYPVDDGLLNQILLPINNIASITLLGLFGVWRIFKRYSPSK